VLGGSTSATVSEGGLVTLGVTEAKFDPDDTLGNVTITGLPGDLSQATCNGGTYTSGTGTWTGTAAQFAALTFHAGDTSATLSISATNTTAGESGAPTVESYTLTVNNETITATAATVVTTENVAKTGTLAASTAVRLSFGGQGAWH
jgi:hypothetical protein